MGPKDSHKAGAARNWLAQLKTRLFNAAITRLPDTLSVQLQFLAAHGTFANLRNAKTFSEKVQVRKLRERDPRFIELADKVLAKHVVSAALGPQWVIPTLWSGAQLPPRQERIWPKPYVLKANHGAGWNAFIRTVADERWDELETLSSRWLATPYLPHLREQHYHAIRPQLLVEPLIGNPCSLPTEYKLFCFDGRAEFVMVQIDRASSLKIATFTRDWTRLDLAYGYEQPLQTIPRPPTLERLVEAAEILAQDFSFVRVDFYEVDGQPFFGEMTFTPGSGLERFEPPSFNEVFGRLWTQDLPVNLGGASLVSQLFSHGVSAYHRGLNFIGAWVFERRISQPSKRIRRLSAGERRGRML